VRTDRILAVNNDFHQTHSIFSLFDGLKVKDMDKPFLPDTAVNGAHPVVNGAHNEVNGSHNEVNGTQSNGLSASVSG
jgi:hypothetical protein